MHAQCPHCHSIYRITAAQLTAAHGEVRCGQCGSTFDALATLTEELPREGIDRLPVHGREAAPPLLGLPSFQPLAPAGNRLHDLTRAGSMPHRAIDLAAAGVLPDPTRRTLPDEAVPRAEPVPRGSREVPARERDRAPPPFLSAARTDFGLGSTALASLLTLSLLLQLAFLSRDHWWATASGQKLVAVACQLLRCRPPRPWAEADLTLVARTVVPDSERPELLQIAALVRNSGTITRDFPDVEVRLLGPDGAPVAGRRFAPAEYLSEPAVADSGLSAGASVPVRLIVEDPGNGAENFEFLLHPSARLPRWLR